MLANSLTYLANCWSFREHEWRTQQEQQLCCCTSIMVSSTHAHVQTSWSATRLHDCQYGRETIELTHHGVWQTLTEVLMTELQRLRQPKSKCLVDINLIHIHQKDRMSMKHVLLGWHDLCSSVTDIYRRKRYIILHKLCVANVKARFDHDYSLLKPSYLLWWGLHHMGCWVCTY